jgi:flagellar hook-associated protein 3 FlgL
MISGLSAANDQFLASLNILQNNLSQADEQLSSGYRVNQASDAPQSVQDIFEIRAELGQDTQTIQNLNAIQGQVQAADSGVQSAIQLLNQAVSLGTEGANTTSSTSSQQTLASQVQAIEAQVVAISNTEVGGVYIFSGDASASPPYKVDTSSPTGVDRLITPQQSTLQIAGPSGVTFQVSMTAQDLFDQRDSNDNPTANNAFAALNSLTQALQSGNTTTIAQAVNVLQGASDYVNDQTGFYGAAETQISSALDLAQKFQTQDQTQLSTLQDADATTLAVQVTQASTALNAAMSADAHMPTTTLFDYLPVD